MKKNYDPNRLTKKQRHMKKWIPDGPYCEGLGEGKHPNPCPFWHDVWNPYMKDKTYVHKKEECCWSNVCDEKDCSQCIDEVSKCSFLNLIQYGQYPLGDMCKICGIHEDWDWE